MPMQVTITAVGPDNRGLADPIVHHVTTAGANFAKIQMYDRDAERLVAMLLRMEWPDEQGPLAGLRDVMHQIGRERRSLQLPRTTPLVALLHRQQRRRQRAGRGPLTEQPAP
jgi:hypothetical protein